MTIPATSTVYAPIMNALLALLQQKCGSLFATYTRRLVPWEMLAQSLQGGGPLIRQPYLCLFDGMLTNDNGKIDYHRQGIAEPARREMHRAIVIYAQLPSVSAGSAMSSSGIDSTTPGGDVFYPLIEAIENALLPIAEPQGALTLGGKVFRCRISGESFMVPGDIDPYGQGMVMLPVKIMLP